MLIPSYTVIQEEFGHPVALNAIPDALFVLISAAFALLWGYYTDRIDRGKVIMAGAFSWTIGMMLTAFSYNFNMLVLSRMISGAGLGCVLPVSYSIISDAIPPDERSGWFGTLAILSSVSNGVGQGLSSFLGPILTWRFPFLLLSGISVIIVIMLFFVKIPQRGASEDELLDLAELNLEYSYRISRRDLGEIVKKKTNRYLSVQSFFAIVPGTILVYFMTSMLTANYFTELPAEIRLQTATIFAGMVGIGYILGNLLLSYLGDILFRRNKKNRARLATFCMIVSIPLALLMLINITPIEVSKLGISYPEPIPTGEITSYMIQTIVAVFKAYPNYIIFFFFALFASILSSGPVANRNAVMIDVNLPEHKGTAASFFNFSQAIGKGITLMLSFFLIMWLGSVFNMMFFAMFLWIPAGVLWYMASLSVESDMDYKSRILTERKQVSLIDYIFEIEIQMDRAIQKVQDSKYYVESNERKFKELLNDAIRLFTFCEKDGEVRSITNIEKKAHIWKIRALLIKQETKKIFKKLNKEETPEKEKFSLRQDLSQIKLRISEWEGSSFGDIQTYYEDAYLKILEARLLRKTDLIQSIAKLNQAINIYGRVKRLLKERLEEPQEGEKLSDDEKIVLEKETQLHDKCFKALKATIKIKEEIDRGIDQLKETGITRSDLFKLSELTAEYDVDIYKVLVDTFGDQEDIKNAIIEFLKEIESIFKQYDKWKETDFAVF